MTNEELHALLSMEKPIPLKPRYLEPDYPKIHHEFAKPGVTLTLLWAEYCDQANSMGMVSYKATQFGDKYRKWAKVTKATMRIQHKPGLEKPLTFGLLGIPLKCFTRDPE